MSVRENSAVGEDPRPRERVAIWQVDEHGRGTCPDCGQQSVVDAAPGGLVCVTPGCYFSACFTAQPLAAEKAAS